MTHLKEEPRLLSEQAEDFGYGAFGPLILRFSAWLGDEARRRGTRRLYFLSREGYFLLDLFRKAASLGLYRADDLDARYLYISRRAAFGAAVKTRDSLEAVLVSGPFEGPLYSLLEARIGLTPHFCASHGLVNSEVSIAGDAESILSLLEPLIPAMNEIAATEREPMLQYLRQEGFFDDEPVALVDVGYSASIQRWMGSVSGRKLTGYYFATTTVVKGWENEDNRVVACFASGCSLVKSPPVYRYALASESWLTAPTGQVLSYEISHGVAQPRFAPEGKTQRDFQVAASVAQGVTRYFEDMAFLAPADPNWEHNLAAMAQNILAAAMESGMYGDVLKALSVEDAFCGNGEISLSDRVADLTSSMRLSDVLRYEGDAV